MSIRFQFTLLIMILIIPWTVSAAQRRTAISSNNEFGGQTRMTEYSPEELQTFYKSHIEYDNNNSPRILEYYFRDRFSWAKGYNREIIHQDDQGRQTQRILYHTRRFILRTGYKLSVHTYDEQGRRTVSEYHYSTTNSHYSNLQKLRITFSKEGKITNVEYIKDTDSEPSETGFPPPEAVIRED